MRIRQRLSAAAASAVSLTGGCLAVAGAAAGSSRAISSLARCATGTIDLVPERTEGTATQAVAFVAVLNTGAACALRTAASLTVLDDGKKLDAVRGNPVTYEANWKLRHGRTLLFSAWWGNWCGGHQKSRFKARSAVGTSTVSVAYSVLPVCLSSHHPSRVTGVLLAH